MFAKGRLSQATIALGVLALSSTAGHADEVTLNTDFGVVSLEIEPDGVVYGDYPTYRGQLAGKLQPDGSLSLNWFQPNSEKRCAAKKGGTFYWGTLNWKPSGKRVAGKWAYCDDRRGSGGAWNGTVTAGGFPATSTVVKAVGDDEMRGAVRVEWGQFALMAEEFVALSIDLDCNGALDRVVSRIDRDNPDGPFFQVLAMTHHKGELVHETLSLKMGGDGGGGSICAGLDTPKPEVTKGPRFDTGEFNNMFGYATQCGQSFVVDDGMCDRKWVFWENELVTESHILVFQN